MIQGNWGKQIELARQQSLGSILFRYDFLPKNPLGVKDSLATSIFRRPVLLPMRDHVAAKPLFPIVFETSSIKSGIQLNWEQERKKGDYYAIYRKEGKQLGEEMEVPSLSFTMEAKIPGLTARQGYSRNTIIRLPTWIAIIKKVHLPISSASGINGDGKNGGRIYLEDKKTS